ncbi:MAG: histidine kinase [Sphingomonas bacterium]|nr:HAMP domain-containing sensor histidine kinase [Sphingomonas bacterium]MDB5688396.1 histidine kinase [Sphingomonas bacterium]
MASPDLNGDSPGGAGAIVRFDDMLATALALPMDAPDGLAMAWRQIADLVGQRRATDDRARAAAYALLRAGRAQVPEPIRADVARSIAGRRLPRELVAFFAEDSPAIAAQILAGAQLSDGEWLSLLPALSPAARGVLHNRRDLSDTVARALASLGACDLVLEGPASPADLGGTAVADAPSEPIAAAPIAPPADASVRGGPAPGGELATGSEEAGRAAPCEARCVPADCAVAGQDAVPHAVRFRFETGADGIILWVEEAPRGPLIGVTLAEAAEPFEHGVDGHVAGAFRRRAPFRDARLSIGGFGSAAGAWRISAVPFFDPVDGRFVGYRGAARRPRADETAAQGGIAAGLYGSALPADSLRQLVHELRTPLNAIVGFAEMIERQMLGPAAHEYRSRAGEIAGHGRRLLATVDDLDVSARVETRRLALDPGPVDTARLLARLRLDYQRIAGERGITLVVAVAEGLPPVAADPAAVERMFARLLAATVGLAEAGETIGVRLARAEDAGERFVSLQVTRPRLLAGRDERGLLDPGYSPDGDWPDAPVLGLGFALRLVRNLALTVGGGLAIGEDAFTLQLPARADSLLSGNRLA